MPVIKQCERCGREYSRPPYLAARARFCSHACQNYKTFVPCLTCGKSFARKPSKVRLRQKQYCSASCRHAAGHVVKTCEGCSAQFEARKDRSDCVRFCSLECKRQNGGIVKVCRRCGAAFRVRKSQSGAIYCRFSCYRLREMFRGDCVHCGRAFEVLKCETSGNQRFCSQRCMRAWLGVKHKGSGNPRWRGGVTPLRQRLHNSKEYREWRRKVFERDGFTCQHCGDKRGGNLHAHHVKFLVTHPELAFEVSNGLTLCKDCHKTLHAELGRVQSDGSYIQYFAEKGMELGLRERGDGPS